MTLTELGGIDIVVNNVATQQPQDRVEDITPEQWLRTFEVNVHSYFWMTQQSCRTCLAAHR